MKILIVEDDFVSRTVLHKQLGAYGDAAIAVNGLEAVEAFKRELESGESYKLVCLDIMMPEMDGQEALRQIRELEKDADIGGLDRCKIIMTTALSGSKDILSSFRDECDGYLVKPIKLQDIQKLLNVLEIESAS